MEITEQEFKNKKIIRYFLIGADYENYQSNIKRGYKMIDKIKKKCEEEIEWGQANIDEMFLPDNPHRYSSNDGIYFSCWKKAHEEMLNFITKEYN